MKKTKNSAPKKPKKSAAKSAAIARPFPVESHPRRRLGLGIDDRQSVAAWWKDAGSKPEAAMQFFSRLPFSEHLAAHPGGQRFFDWCLENWTDSNKSILAPVLDGRFLDCLNAAATDYLSNSSEKNWKQLREVASSLSLAAALSVTAFYHLADSITALESARHEDKDLPHLKAIRGIFDENSGYLDFYANSFCKDLERESLAGFERRMGPAAKGGEKSRRGAAIRYISSKTEAAGVPDTVTVALLVAFFSAFGQNIDDHSIRSVILQARRPKQKRKSVSSI
jgi:hypothetical protein